MEQSLAFLIVVIAFPAAFGWGMQLERLVYGRPAGRAPYSMALGLIAWLGIGALLDYLALATALAFDVLLVAGLLFAALEWWRRGLRLARPALGGEWLPPVIAIAVGAYLGFSLLPASAFNFHDDFYKYLPRAVRMLQTGTLAGNPYDIIGIDGLGMQTFLQGMFIAHLPLAYINAFDAVFCLVLAALLVDSLGRELETHWALRSLAVAALLVINPQYVNVSPLYSGMAMIIAMSLATLLLVRTVAEGNDRAGSLAAIPVGLFAATLAGLKVTFIPYAAGYLLLLLLLAVIHPAIRGRVLKPALAAAVAGLALYGAWAAPFAGKLLEFVHLAGQRTESGMDQLAMAGNSDTPSYLTQVIERGELLYGGHIHHYLALLAIIALLALVATILLYRRRAAMPALLTAATMALACLVSTFGILINVYGIHVDGLVRYNAPILAAVLPSVTLLLYPAAACITATPSRWPGHAFTAAAVLLLCAPLLMQGGLWLDHARRALAERHLLAYPLSGRTLQQLQIVLSPQAREEMHKLQQRIPAGATVLSWTNLPFDFDFRRNTIYTLGSPSLFRGIEQLGPRYQPLWLRRKLREDGVGYVIWLYNGNRQPPWGGKYLVLMERALDHLAHSSKVVYADPNLVVFSLDPR